MQSAVPESDGPKLGNEAEAEARGVRRDKTKASQSAGLPGTMEIEHRGAVPDFDGLKLGNEVKVEIHDVRRDKTKVGQSAELSGTMKVEHQAAGHVAGSQTRPKSPVPAVAGPDAGWAVKTAENEAALAGVKAAGLSGTMSELRGRSSCGDPGSTRKPHSCCCRSRCRLGGLESARVFHLRDA